MFARSLSALPMVLLVLAACGGDDAPATGASALAETAPCPGATAPGAVPTTPACASPQADASAVRDGCGVFVAPSGSDESGNGSMEKPFASLARAAKAASTTSLRVFACTGAYDGVVDLPAGVSIHGGFLCEQHWKHGDKHSVLRAPANVVGLRILDAGTVAIDDLDVIAPSATIASGSSISVIVQNANVTFLRSVLTAGDGAPGAAGVRGADGAVAGDAERGRDGVVSCSGGALGNLGAAGGTSSLAPEATGGAGGTGFEVNGTAGGAGAVIVDPTRGLGGKGAFDAVGVCQLGDGGATVHPQLQRAGLASAPAGVAVDGHPLRP